MRARLATQCIRAKKNGSHIIGKKIGMTLSLTTISFRKKASLPLHGNDIAIILSK